MRLPIAILLFVAVCLAVMPWRRTDPRHVFILNQLKMLSDPDDVPAADSTVLAEEESGYRTAVSYHHRVGSPHV